MWHRIFYLLGILIVFFFTVNHSAYAMKIIGFGNSITQGYPYVSSTPNGARIGGYEPELERLLSQQGVGATVLNYGVAGETIGEGVARIDSVLDQHPDADYILIMEGTNDVIQSLSLDNALSNLSRMIDTARARGIEPILANLVPNSRSSVFWARTRNTWNPAIAWLADQKNTIFADQYWSIVDHWDSKNFDDVHPNRSGYSTIAKTWMISILPPDVFTLASENTQKYSATLNGLINTRTYAITYWFEYGESTAYQFSTDKYDLGEGHGDIEVAVEVEDLEEDTEYHFRLVVKTISNTHFGDDLILDTDKESSVPGCFIQSLKE